MMWLLRPLPFPTWSNCTSTGSFICEHQNNPWHTCYPLSLALLKHEPHSLSPGTSGVSSHAMWMQESGGCHFRAGSSSDPPVFMLKSTQKTNVCVTVVPINSVSSSDCLVQH